MKHVAVSLTAITHDGGHQFEGELNAIKETLARHENDIQRSDRTIAALRRQLAGQELADAITQRAIAAGGAAPGSVTTTSQSAGELFAIVDLFDRDTAALLKSRRWRFGHAVGRIFAPGIRRRRHELASTRLDYARQRVAMLDRASLLSPATATSAAAQFSASAVARSSEHNSWAPPPAGAYAVFILANVGWDGPQHRPHHIAQAFAAHGHPVFYASINAGSLGDETLVDDGVIEVEFKPTRSYDRYSTIPDDDMVADWLVAVEALRLRHGIDEAVVHVHLPSWAPLAWALRSTFGWRIVYDCMDEWEDFPRVGRAFVEPEKELVAGADLVVTTAEKLRAKCAPMNPRTLLVRNGVDADFFTNNCAPSDVLSDVPHPIIGFTGTLAEWVDFELLAAVARERPDWTFVLVGYVYVGVDGLFGLERLPNVILTGLQPYQTMPSYLFWFDVAIIPFVNDNISAAVDPVKFYEYAASGKPIVTTDLPELAEHSHLFHSAVGAVAVEAAIEKALAEDPALAIARVELAHANTWESRYRTLDAATRALWPTLSIVLITYGQLAFTRRCLDTLIANTTYPALEIIVVDNGSTDGTALYLQHLAGSDSRIKLILNSHNRGFAPANNQGLVIATGDVLILLNNDTELSPGWYVPLLRHLEDHTIGLVGPRTDSVGNEALIAVPPEYAADLNGFCRLLQREHEGKTFDIEMLGMFCVAMRREVYEAVGPLDEGYEIGMFEDDDYSQRIRAEGWRVACARDAFVHHVGNATFKSLIASGEYQRIWDRNRALYEARWGPWRPNGEVIRSHD